jgi:hypothetical protein
MAKVGMILMMMIVFAAASPKEGTTKTSVHPLSLSDLVSPADK